MMTTKDALEAVRIAMYDHSYAWSWQCNLAMSICDEGVDHKTANKAAARFMKLCFDIDITTFPEYQKIIQ